jgi:hypothetical protein
MRGLDSQGHLLSTTQLEEKGWKVGMWMKRVDDATGVAVTAKLIEVRDEERKVVILWNGQKGKLDVASLLEGQWQSTVAPAEPKEMPGLADLDSFQVVLTQGAVLQALHDLYNKHKDAMASISCHMSPKKKAVANANFGANKLVLVPLTAKIKTLDGEDQSPVTVEHCEHRFGLIAMQRLSAHDVGGVPFWFATADKDCNLQHKLIKMGSIKIPCLTNPVKIVKGASLHFPKVKEVKEEVPKQPQSIIDFQSMVVVERTRKRQKTTPASVDVE